MIEFLINNQNLILTIITWVGGIVGIVGGLNYVYRKIVQSSREEVKTEQMESKIKALAFAKKNREYIESLPLNDKLKFLRSPSRR